MDTLLFAACVVVMLAGAGLVYRRLRYGRQR